MKYTSKALALFFIFGGASIATGSTAQTITQTKQSSQSEFNYEGWQIMTRGYRSTGKTAQTEHSSHNAEQTWLIVSASIRKIGVGGNRIPPLGFNNAQLIDTNGFVYPLSRIEYKSQNIGEPFKPGEIRVSDLMFDVPSGTRPRFLIIYFGNNEELSRIKI